MTIEFSLFKLFLDPWCDGLFLSEKFSFHTLRSVSSNKQIELSSLIVQNQWHFTDIPLDVQMYLQQFQIFGGEDQIMWQHKMFTFKAAWEACRVPNPVVQWYSLVWNGGRPRWSVQCALIIQNAVLPAQNLQRRGISLASRCCLCLKNAELDDHVFVECDYSWQVWCGLASMFHWRVQKLSCEGFAAAMTQQFQVRSLRNKVFKMIFSATMYYLWNERNYRLHKDIFSQLNISWLRSHCN
ncbi:uncharacterized protein LOC132267230 isoform X2 [Cornus florida]|uniref:uncharacterized protein LOC132267230 isoform X2 n=1 Tax=Cornus florida TaxID=4283 RepID=UPI0028A19DB7|nr:uncharacterized protein LOC132267230 isoform X2 [Cornus florida]